jgi:hypothetical protein
MRNFSRVIRLAGIVLDIMSAVQMAQRAFGFTFSNDFVEILTRAARVGTSA